jgi:mannan endo-1,4-beta-mannosidase
MRPLKIITLRRRAVSASALLLLCVVIAGCKGLFGGHGGKNLTAPVTGLTAAAASGQVTLNWNAYPGASSYNIWRSTTSTLPTGGPITYLPIQNPPTGTTFTDTTVTSGTTYYYAVNANGNWGVSNFSNVVSATP